MHFCAIYLFFSQWFNILNRVHRANDEELKGMREESANVKHAAVSHLSVLQAQSACLSLWIIEHASVNLLFLCLGNHRCGHDRVLHSWRSSEQVRKGFSIDRYQESLFDDKKGLGDELREAHLSRGPKEKMLYALRRSFFLDKLCLHVF